MLGRHLEFIRERQYVMDVSPATIRWYPSALKWLDTEAPTQEELTRLVVKMRERGLKATGCNAATRAINAYLHWSSGAKGKCGGGCRHPHVKPMKEPEFVPSVFTDDQIKKLVRFSGRRFFERRTTSAHSHSARHGMQGQRSHRAEGHRRRYGQSSADAASRAGDEMGRGTALHDVKRLCRRLGFEPPARTLHSFRHYSECQLLPGKFVLALFSGNLIHTESA